jgi:signal transduction histidine kinase
MAIGLNIDLVRKKLVPALAADQALRLATTADLVRETMLSSRDISGDLHPATLDYDGIVSALEDYGGEFARRTGIAVLVKDNCRDLRFAPEHESALFRIAQEALMNSAKHALARHVTIELSCDAGRPILTILDDGVGFDLSSQAAPPGSSGLGLLSMKERAEAFGGTFRIESSPETGTTIIVEV